MTFFQRSLEVFLYHFEPLSELKLRHVFSEQINLVYTSEFLYVTYQRQFCCFEVSNTNGLKF
jgi:hypothetical protein